MRIASGFFITAILALMLGCASSNQQPVHAAPPPVAGPDAATIIFFRITGPPAAVKGILSVDGYELGKVFVRRYAIFKVAPGMHELRFSFPMWAGTKEQIAQIECRPNERYFVAYD